MAVFFLFSQLNRLHLIKMKLGMFVLDIFVNPGYLLAQNFLK